MLISAASALFLATQFYVLADANAVDPNAAVDPVVESTECVAVGVDPNAIPFEIPAGAVVGLILAPDPNDPNDWHAPAGKFNRVGQWCDPDGDPIAVSLVSSTVPGAGVYVQGSCWFLVGELVPGLNLFVVEAQDYRLGDDAKKSTWTIPVWGDGENRGPVLR